MSKRVYVAAPYVARREANRVACELHNKDYEITQHWWDFEGTEQEKGAGFLKMCAELDYRGVRTADAMFLLNSAKSEGKAVEQGIAIALGIPIIAVGIRGEFSQNVFHYLPNYHWVPTVEAGFEKLKEVVGE
jgi:nucleoside 2-deoxyribosyltransferase